MTESTLADRLWWARHKMRVGANILSREAGCPQSLISSLERNNSDRSKYTNEFAKVLKVDAHWLATGNGRVPEGFDPAEVRRARKQAGNGEDFFNEPTPLRVRHTPSPRWTDPSNDNGDADPVMLWVGLLPRIRQLRKIVGAKQFAALLESLEHLDPVAADKG